MFRLVTLRWFGALALLTVPLAPAAQPRSDMVALPGGTFMAGELTGVLQDTAAYHRVRPFLLDAAEVTVTAYAECVKAGKCKPAAAKVKWDLFRRADREAWSARCNRDREDRADHPVNCVDWHQARAYCAWAGKRLPSEEEWEWAARNGKKGTAYPWGDEPPGDRACWSGEGSDAGKGSRSGTCPVGSHPAGDTESGVKDLAGNVWEWTSSRTLVGADSRGRGGSSARIARGGSWADTDPWRLSAAVRLHDLPTLRSPDVGFRCAKRP